MSAVRRARDERLTNALDQNARDLLRYLERRVGSNDAPDALSDTMIAAWKGAARVPTNPVEARMWLFGIARNVVLNHSRGERRRSRLAERLRESVGVLPPNNDAAAGLDVLDAIQRLDPDLAEVIRAVHWDGFSLAEISQYLGLPASTVRSRYHRAKRELAHVLGSQVELIQ
ncbi:RNA polymerase sigma factor [Cryobacterium gelidum]|uniref:RNA polymerase sigma factor n=1 Tax=Cryobacterium gelidum TaxID=1259164 RepID=A0A4R9B051_9MICO|nr:RNA polymerase sigma factor [Cryobacterium gelidum]TFD73489.1 RNA polymerase sigma factor [Cryobacterium gelidum]